VLASPCTPFAGGGSLRVEGIGAAEFALVTGDSAREELILSGGVCVAFDGSDAVLRAERLRVWRELEWQLAAEEVSLRFGDVELEGGRLWLAGESLVLEAATLQSAEAAGYADRVTVAWRSGDWGATSVRLATAIGWWDAESASATDEGFRFEQVWFSTCDCPPGEAPARIEGAWLEVILDPLRLRVGGGEWVSGLGRSPLPDPMTIDPAAWDRWAPVLRVSSAGGLSAMWAQRTLVPGVRFRSTLASGWPHGTPSVALDARAQAVGGSIHLEGASDRLRVQWQASHPLTDAWTFALGQRLELGAWPTSVRDSWWRLQGNWDVPLPWEGARLEGSLALLGALTNEGEGSDALQGVRLGWRSSWMASGPTRSGITPRIGMNFGVSHYPAWGAQQSWVELTPAVVWRWPNGSLTLDHRARWVAGASPFSAAIDGLTPLQQPRAILSVRGTAGPLADLDARLAAAWDIAWDAVGAGWRMRWTTLDPRLQWTLPLGTGTLAAHLEGSLAGWLQGDSRGARAFEGALRLEQGPLWWEAEFAVAGRANRDATRTLGVALGAEEGEVLWRASLAVEGDLFDPIDRVGAEVRGELSLLHPEWGLAATTHWHPWGEAPSPSKLILAVDFPRFGDRLGWRPALEVDVMAWARREGWAAGWRGYGLDVAWATRLGTLEFGAHQRVGDGWSLSFGVALPDRVVAVAPVLASRDTPLRDRATGALPTR
jgi:hypothetical protein